jgi:hypothetical protein
VELPSKRKLICKTSLFRPHVRNGIRAEDS